MEEKCISPILEHVVPMELSALHERSFQTVTYCHVCDEELGTDRVRDHCHLTEKYRGATHTNCNLNYKFTKHIPVVFHNLKNYDAYLLIKAMEMIKDKAISGIPTTDEKYISFSIEDLTLIDSLQFLNASLEKLVSNLAKERGWEIYFLIDISMTKRYCYFSGKASTPMNILTVSASSQKHVFPPDRRFLTR